MNIFTLRHAFTLLELMMSITILSMVMMLTTQSLDMGSKLNDRVTRQTDINNRANDVLNRLAMQLRMASAGNSTATSLELPGTYPVGFVADDPTRSNQVVAYKFAMSTGLATTAPWREQYETFKREIIYDGSRNPGRLLLRTRNQTSGAWDQEQLLSNQVANNGFSLSRVGNTLQMSITLRTLTERTNEEILYTAQAQTIFLRSTFNASSGASSVTYVDNPEDADGNIAGATTTAPAVMFGNLVTEETTSPPRQQISFFITAPIGQTINPNSISVSLGNNDNSVSSVVAEGATVTVAGVTMTRRTYPPSNQWPSRNGTYSVTLIGSIPANTTITVSGTAANASGVSASEVKRYDRK
jgi:prepilin-type N-terminal cleavage/methylation domain-containing protein